MTRVSFDPVTAAFAARLDGPPLTDLSLEEARAGLPAAQAAAAVPLPSITVEDLTAPGRDGSAVKVRIFRPPGVEGRLPVVVYGHGGGWVFGDRETHGRLVAELAIAARAAVVLVDYDRAPEARHPTQVRQGIDVLRWVADDGSSADLDARRVAVAGDSSGANLATVWAMLSATEGVLPLAAQVLFFPTLDARFDTGSYEEFASGPYLDRPAMRWFWDPYLPDRARRGDATASPLRAELPLLTGLPPTLVITAEADVLRDEGEAYARRLVDAGVEVTAVRYLGAIHAFVVLDALAATPPARAAVAQAGGFLREHLWGAR
jgi:acetyl esterase/lipase